MKNYTCPVLSGNRTVHFRAAKSSLLDDLALEYRKFEYIFRFGIFPPRSADHRFLSAWPRCAMSKIARTTGCYC